MTPDNPERFKEHLDLLITLTLAVTTEKDFVSATLTTLKKICENTSWVYGDAWLINKGHKRMEFIISYTHSKFDFSAFTDQSKHITFKEGEGMPGKAWQTKNSVWVDDITQLSEEEFPRKNTALLMGFKCSVAIPLPLNDEVIAVMAFYGLESHDENKKFVEILQAVAQQLGMLLKQKQTEESLRQSEARYISMVESSPNGVFLSDSAGKIIYANEAGENLFGYSSGELLSENLKIIIPERYRNAHENGMKRYSATKNAKVIGHPVELEGLRKDGSEFPVTLSIGTWDERGETFFSGIVHDITDTKTSEKRLRELLDLFQHTNEELSKQMADKMKAEKDLLQLNETLEEKVKDRTKELKGINEQLKEFAYIVSHDLKAPLRSISTLSDFIIMDYEDKLGDEGKEQLLTLKEKVKKMSGLVEGILKYAKAGSRHEEKEEVNINNLVKDVAEFISLPANIKLEIETPLPIINTERIPVFQVFQNLIDNAVKYIDKPEGIIKIGAIEKENKWKFYISDNGPGIDEKYHKKIFKVFQTLSNSKEGSTGVGLSVVKKNIESIGGEIWVESTLKEGSTFYFTVPK